MARLLEEAETDLLAFLSFPPEHHTKLRSTNPLERVNREIGRRSDVVGIYPNNAALIRLASMLLIEQNDEWLVGRRYLSQESIALIYNPHRPSGPGEADQPALAGSAWPGLQPEGGPRRLTRPIRRSGSTPRHAT